MPILGVIASSTRQGQSTIAGSYEPIAVATVPSGGLASITFGSIPQTYTHLQIRSILRSNHTAEDYPTIKVNGTSIPVRHALSTSGGGTVQSSGSTSGTQDWGAIPGTDTASNIFSAFIIDILDYQNTNKNKTFRFLNGLDKNGSGAILFQSGLVLSTSAITSITFETYYSKNYSQYSSLALYGIKGA